MLGPSFAKVGWLALAFLGVASCARGEKASVVTYEFTVTIEAGPLRGSHIGTFSYNSSSITPLHTNHATDVLTTLNFRLNGITYNARTAHTGELTFGPTGNLLLNHGPLFGTGCDPNVCRVDPGVNSWDVDGTIFFYGSSAPSGFGVGNVSYRLVGKPSS
ncbi:MAG: hypothetical protein ACREFV_00270 [Acetobacteraceae bacterium]